MVSLVESYQLKNKMFYIHPELEYEFYKKCCERVPAEVYDREILRLTTEISKIKSSFVYRVAKDRKSVV